MYSCDKCEKKYQFDELEKEKDPHFEECEIIKCPKGHTLNIPIEDTIETMHMICRTFLRKINNMGKVEYICDKCKKKFSISPIQSKIH